MSYECLLRKYQEATQTIQNMEMFIKKYVEESQEESRIMELENDFKRSCSLLQKQSDVIKALRNTNKLLREKVTSLTTKESPLLDTNFPEQIEDIKNVFMRHQNEVAELQAKNASLQVALEETTREKEDLVAKLARLSEAQGPKVELDVGPAVSEFASPAEYRIAELEKTVAYLTEELDKESAKLIDYAKREKALKEDHRRTWMELRRANEKIEELTGLKQLD